VAPKGEELPKIDEATGEEVSVLMEDFSKASSSKLFNAVYYAFSAGIPIWAFLCYPVRQSVMISAVVVSSSAVLGFA